MRQHIENKQTADMAEEVHSRVDFHRGLEFEQHKRKHQVGDGDFGGQKREHIVSELWQAMAKEQRSEVSPQRTACLGEESARDEGEVVAGIKAMPVRIRKAEY